MSKLYRLRADGLSADLVKRVSDLLSVSGDYEISTTEIKRNHISRSYRSRQTRATNDIWAAPIVEDVLSIMKIGTEYHYKDEIFYQVGLRHGLKRSSMIRILSYMVKKTLIKRGHRGFVIRH